MQRKTQLKPTATSILDELLQRTVELGASDLHLEPEPDRLRIRLRVDGSLRELNALPLQTHSHLISRIKVLSKLNIAETRTPQDGRFTLQAEAPIDLRVSVFPTEYGEAAVIRILDQARMLLPFTKLGFEPEQEKLFTEVIHKPFGLILVTGPNGSGKTTTLFSVLNSLNETTKCITTLEDPIEYRLPRIRQSQVRPEIGFDFAQGLRSLLRQNPDIIMVGEIRDEKTADIAIQAGMTGHLVLSTLHTNDSVGALIRLREMGLEKFLIISATIGVVAQRLIRLVCSECCVPDQPPAHVVTGLGLTTGVGSYFTGQGCSLCQGTGYRGQTGIFEIFRLSPKINQLFYKDASWHELKSQALQERLITLRTNGLIKARRGETTLAEVLRVTSD